MNQNFTSWVFDSVDFDRDQPLLINASKPECSLSFNQLHLKVRQLVAGIKAIGIKPGDCVCVNAFNDISYSVLYLGIIGAGAIFTAVNPAYSVHELVHHITMVSAKLIIAEPAMMRKTMEASDSCGISRSNLLAFDVNDECLYDLYDDICSWRSLLEYGESEFETCEEEGAVASYKTSSGTTGLPKAVMIPHEYLIEQARLKADATNINYEVRRLTALPPMHAFATPIVPASIRQGAPTYIMRRYEVGSFVDAIERYQISETFLAPPMVVQIPRWHLTTKQTLSSLRQIWFGGAAVSQENQAPLVRLLHRDARVYACWGMTEVGWATPGGYPEVQSPRSVGRPVEGCKIRAVDDNGRPLLSCAEGELQIRTPYPMLGYLNNPTATKEAFTVDEDGRWVNTGDIGYVDERGHIHIVDRKKDLIKVRGWQVSPAEVEGCILEHSEVTDVGVIGVPQSDGQGERVCAFVVKHCDGLLTAQDVKKFAATKLANFKCPADVVFIDSIPRNPTGKILRRLLRDGSMPKAEIAPMPQLVEMKPMSADLSLGSALLTYGRKLFLGVIRYIFGHHH